MTIDELYEKQSKDIFRYFAFLVFLLFLLWSVDFWYRPELNEITNHLQKIERKLDEIK